MTELMNQRNEKKKETIHPFYLSNRFPTILKCRGTCILSIKVSKYYMIYCKEKKKGRNLLSK